MIQLKTSRYLDDEMAQALAAAPESEPERIAFVQDWMEKAYIQARQMEPKPN